MHKKRKSAHINEAAPIPQPPPPPVRKVNGSKEKIDSADTVVPLEKADCSSVSRNEDLDCLNQSILRLVSVVKSLSDNQEHLNAKILKKEEEDAERERRSLMKSPDEKAFVKRAKKGTPQNCNDISVDHDEEEEDNDDDEDDDEEVRVMKWKSCGRLHASILKCFGDLSVFSKGVLSNNTFMQLLDQVKWKSLAIEFCHELDDIR